MSAQDPPKHCPICGGHFGGLKGRPPVPMDRGNLYLIRCSGPCPQYEASVRAIKLLDGDEESKQLAWATLWESQSGCLYRMTVSPTSELVITELTSG